MTRDSRNALVALNRFGFGARGGASGDFINAAFDPRGFVKADLARPSAALLEVPGLQSTPELGRTFAGEDGQPAHAKVAVISHALWVSMFGASPDVLKRSIKLDGTNYQIVGVMPPKFEYPSSPIFPMEILISNPR